jgi:hypothetical protein
MGPRGANRNYTYSKIRHINSQEGKVGPILLDKVYMAGIHKLL